MSTPEEQATEDTQDQNIESGQPSEVDEDALFEEAIATVEGSASDDGEKSENTDTDPEEAHQSNQSEGEMPAEESGEQQTTEEAPSFEELSRRLAKAEYENHSHRNRQSTLARQMNAAKEELEQYKKRIAELEAQGNAQSAATGTDVNVEEVASASDVDLKQFAEDFPEVFAAINAVQKDQLNQLNQQWQERFTAVNQQLEQVSQPIQALQQRDAQQAMESELATLASVHPDYQQIQDSMEFWQWVDGQTDRVRSLVESNSAADNIALLDLYKSSVGAPRATSPSQAAVNAPTAPRSSVPRSAEAAESLPRTSTGRPVGGVPDDEDAAFDYWAERV